MEIYFIRYRDDDPAEEGMWLDRDVNFYARKEVADKVCETMNGERLSSYKIQQQRSLEKWEKNEKAFIALSLSKDIDPHDVLPYHRREFRYEPFSPVYIVDSIKVDD